MICLFIKSCRSSMCSVTDLPAFAVESDITERTAEKVPGRRTGSPDRLCPSAMAPK